MEPIDLTRINPVAVGSGSIETEAGPFCMSFEFDLTPLIRSIREVGLLCAPLLSERDNGKMSIVAGHRRVLALRSLNHRTIPCKVFPQSQLSPLQCLLLNLHDNLSVRKLNDVEKAMALRRLSSHLPNSDIVHTFMPLLGLPQHEPTFLFFLAVDKELDRQTKRELARGRLSLHAAKTLLDMDQESRAAASEALSNLNLNKNQQRQFLDLMLDISQRDRCSIAAIMSESRFQAIYADSRLNSPVKADKVLRLLRERRFPRLAQAEKAFRSSVARLGLPDGVSIQASPYFESPQYKLEVLFTDGEELRKKIDRLTQVSGLSALMNPWEATS